MTQFKDKSAKQRELVSAGLFFYPVLMAADVLAYRGQEVPVGHDQLQHVELMREIARRFNERFGEILVVPEARIPEVGARIMDLQEPTNKMSTTGGTQAGTVLVLDDPKTVTKKIKSAVTDSGSEVKRGEGKEGIANLIEILAVARGSTRGGGRERVRRLRLRRLQGGGGRGGGGLPGAGSRALRGAAPGRSRRSRRPSAPGAEKARELAPERSPRFARRSASVPRADPLKARSSRSGRETNKCRCTGPCVLIRWIDGAAAVRGKGQAALLSRISHSHSSGRQCIHLPGRGDGWPDSSAGVDRRLRYDRDLRPGLRLQRPRLPVQYQRRDHLVEHLRGHHGDPDEARRPAP